MKKSYVSKTAAHSPVATGIRRLMKEKYSVIPEVTNKVQKKSIYPINPKYASKYPIEESVKARLAAGAINAMIPPKVQPQIHFQLELKGDGAYPQGQAT